jgi:hypothetical protein
MSTHRYEERLKALNEDPDGHGFKASNSPVRRHVALQCCATMLQHAATLRNKSADPDGLGLRRKEAHASAFPEGGGSPTNRYN